MNGVAIGVLLVVLGAAGLLVAVSHRRAVQDLALEHYRLAERAELLDRRAERLEVESHALYEWEGRLRQVAECGCPVPDRSLDVPYTDRDSPSAA